MVLLSLLPIGLLQAWAEFLQTGLMNGLRWMRVIGDTIFASALVLGWRGVVHAGEFTIEPADGVPGVPGE